jgi:RNA polymerase sigma-70 factor (ECF subfamily)
VALGLTLEARAWQRPAVVTARDPAPVEAVQQHELDAELLAHAATLRALALRLAGSAADADDLVQETFARALEKRAGLQPGTNPRAWLVTILHHLFIDRCRRRRKEADRVSIDDLPVAAPEPAPEPAWSRLSADDVRAAVARLGEEFRVVYTMHALENRSYQEISVALGIPVATVGTRMSRARAKLRALLQELAA